MRPILRFSEKKIYWKCQRRNAVSAKVSLQYGKKGSVKRIIKIENSNSPDSAQRISVSEAGRNDSAAMRGRAVTELEIRRKII